jgi:hypothetical protein
VIRRARSLLRLERPMTWLRWIADQLAGID